MILLSAELPRPMKIRPFMLYAAEKLKQDGQRDNYLFDCLWAMATDRRFVHEKEPTLPRWHEVNAVKKVQKEPPITKEMVRNRFKRLLG